VLKPWQKIPILQSSESLVDLPEQFSRIDPHQYLSLGAPYGKNITPWRLRADVIHRLHYAQQKLQYEYPELQLLIFDCWRPIRVQKFMYEYAINQECISCGLSVDASRTSNDRDFKKVVYKVNKFWAFPSYNKSTPPPHSTGAAVDLTLSIKNGSTLNMGGAIDLIGRESEPNYYLGLAKSDRKSLVYLWHSRRLLLRNIMTQSGFVQHPNEWWHFSFGDQLWAWQTKSDAAFYGAI